MAASAAGEFVMRCFHARTNAHVLHLKTRSYAAHRALDEFYTELVPLVDAFAEAWQGEYGLIERYPGTFVPADEPLPMLDALVKWIETSRARICDDTCCQNIIDEVVALVRSTQYKLRFLK